MAETRKGEKGTIIYAYAGEGLADFPFDLEREGVKVVAHRIGEKGDIVETRPDVWVVSLRGAVGERLSNGLEFVSFVAETIGKNSPIILITSNSGRDAFATEKLLASRSIPELQQVAYCANRYQVPPMLTKLVHESLEGK